MPSPRSVLLDIDNSILYEYIRIVEIFGQKVGVRTKPMVQIVFSIKVSAFNFLSYYDRQWLHICSKMLQQQNVISLCFVSRAPSAKNGH